MASMTILSGTTMLSDYGSRSVTLEVVGGYPARRTAVHRVTVPYRSLSQTIQNIQRLGGKINQVMLSSAETGLGEERSAAFSGAAASLEPAVGSDQAVSSIQVAMPEPASCQEALPMLESVQAVAQVEAQVEARVKTKAFVPSPQPRRSKPAAQAQPSPKSSKGTQGQRPKRKSKS